MLAPAPQRDDGRERLVHGRARRDHRQVAERLPLGGQPYPQEHPVVVGGEGEPVAAHPFAERQTVPAAVDLTVHDLAVVEQRPEVRARAGPSLQHTVLAAPQHHLAAHDGARYRPGEPEVRRTADDVPTAGVVRLGDLERLADAGRPGLTPGAGQVIARFRRHPAQRVDGAPGRPPGRGGVGGGAQGGHQIITFVRGGPTTRMRELTAALRQVGTRALVLNTSKSFSSMSSRIRA